MRRLPRRWRGPALAGGVLVLALLLGAVMALVADAPEPAPGTPTRSTTAASSSQEPSTSPTTPVRTDAPTREATATSSPTSSSSTTGAASSSTTSSPDPHEGHDDVGPAAIEDDALAVAADFVDLVATHQGSTPGVWRRAVTPMLSQDGAWIARSTPADLGVGERTGMARQVVGADFGPDLVPVGVPTDTGLVLVLLAPEAGTWAVVSIDRWGQSG